MAFSNTPQTSTYDTKRLDLVFSPMQRSGSLPNKDARYVNVMPEVVANTLTQNKKHFIKSRPGVATAYTCAAGVGRGIYYWTLGGVGYTFSVIGSDVRVNGVTRLTLTTSTGPVNFTEFVNSTGNVSLILVDGTKGYVWTDSTTVTTITSADFPTPHVPNPIFLDGYLFLAKLNTHDIYNSNLNDPLLWTPGDYISAEMYPDTIVALSRNNNYIYAIGENSVEYLYDAANTTASPLARHDAAVQQFGCAAPATVVQTEKEVIFVGATDNGGHTVWIIDGFKETEIGIPAIKHVLLTEGTSLINANAYSIRVSGQKLYILMLTSRTLVYSFDTKSWSEWASGATSTTAFLAGHGHDGPNGTAYVLGNTSGLVYVMSETYFTDAGTAFRCEIVTPRLDFESNNRKFMSRLSLLGDIPDSTGTDNDVSIEWSDDDYNTWSTARILSFNYDFPVLRQLGAFRRRAFRFRYSLPHLLRLEGFEVDINKGQQ